MARQIKYGRYLHGGDYNPEQWLDRPDILQKDIEYFKKAHINTVSVGIFSWAVLEPEEGKYNFDWLEEIINNLFQPAQIVLSFFWFQYCPGKDSYRYCINMGFFEIFNVFFQNVRAVKPLLRIIISTMKITSVFNLFSHFFAS